MVSNHSNISLTALLLLATSSIQGGPKKEATKFCKYLGQLLTDFQNFFTAAFCDKFVVKWLLNIPPHLNYVATLPCEISNM